MTRPEWIEVGRVARPHGVHGEVRIIVDSDNPERFVEGAIFHARPAREPIVGARSRERMRLTVSSVRGGGGAPILAFREVSDRDMAAGLRGWLLEVPGADLPELAEDEYYPFQLEGLEVRDPEGAVVGRVREVVDTPAHPVLSIILESGRETMVPFVMDAVPEVVPSEGYLSVKTSYLVEL